MSAGSVPTGEVAIKKRSRVPGVMITQYVENLPPGKTTPDFTRKPTATTTQEGKTAFFKAAVTGEPAPTITWARNKGEISDPEKYKTRYDEKSGEYILEVLNVTVDRADTYKCFATNPFGRAVSTATLNVIEVGFKKKKPGATQNDPEDFRKMLKKTVIVKKRKEKPKKEGEIDPKFWEVLLSAQKKDYERICREFGVTNYRWMLKKLNMMKKEQEEEQAKVVENVENLKQIEVKTNGKAEFEIDMKLKDPNSKIFLYKDGEILDYGDGTDKSSKHNMKKAGDKYTFSVNNVAPEDAGLYQVDVDDVNIFSTGLEIPDVEFDGMLKDAKVVEGQDATFECILSGPVAKITWCAKDASVEPGDKYDITVSEDMLTHRLVVKNCQPGDKGIYTAIAGIKLSKASLNVKDDPNARGKGQSGAGDANSLAEEQARLQKERDEAARRGQAKSGSGLRDGFGGDGISGDGSGQTGIGRDKMRREGLGKEGAVDSLGRDGLGKDGLGKGGAGDGSGKEGLGKGGSGLDESGITGLGRGGSGSDGTEKASKGGLAADGSGKDGLGRNGKDGRGGEGTSGDGSGGDGTGDAKHKKRIRDGPLVPDTITEPGVHFLSGLSDSTANTGESAELTCKLSSKDSVGIWYKDGKKLESKDGVTIVKDGPTHRLIIKNCKEENTGTYKFEADGRKSEATLRIEDPPKINADALSKFSEPIIVKAGENAIFKLPFSGKEPVKVQWFKDEEELLHGPNAKIESSSTHSRLFLTKCQRKDTGEVKIKIKNEFATIEAASKLIVLDKPAPPQGPVEVVESSLSAIEFKWRPPKDDGGCPVTNYYLERQQAGRNTWTKIGDIPGQPTYRDTDIDRGRKYCYRIRAKNSEGISDMMETDDIAAGTLAFPGQPACPKVVSAFKDCINLSWLAPSNTGGGSIIGYNVEKRKKGSNLWSQVNPPDEPIREKKYAVKDVMEGGEYEFRVVAINTCGPGEPSGPSDCVFARDPQKHPGKVKDLKVTGSSYTTLCLAWTKPKAMNGVEDEAKGYFVEIRPTDQLEWTRCNTSAVVQTSFTVVGLKSLAMYWVRVIATNEGGEGLPQGFDNYVIAMPPPVKPKFTDRKMKSFMVVKAGNTVRVNIRFEASPLPDITWLKDSVPVAKHVTITNSEKGSQLLIPSSERSDTGIYTIIVKNMVGQDTFNVEIRVTDEPMSPGPVQLEQIVEGTVTLMWTPSPDEKRDDRLHYMVMKRDSVKRTWRTVADHLFNHKFTVVNIMQGREYNFRVFAKNDMGLSEPSESPAWGTIKKKEKFVVNLPKSKILDFRSAPKFTVPLKLHAAPKGYECYMSCAVSGNPKPHVTWYRNNISLNTNTNYYITNTCGVCSMLILMVGPKDTGEYRVVAENPLGKVECSTQLTVRE
ncbi:immunoglobulin-like and fibronectin type III domain-containing protein 1 isoform X2 [Colossoma macropomum]|uniref:immunoglobulin-like and fibronectin type III domain-containing protein 1 isoform X2 n=1 Tax=Colossoma macropomum TaxID=42526 RepID=UPI0018654312|nr:immunoglobulin-like and fibronectin type III domain-containing protein 1 isoform X2 [Colossoma macropomum]